SRPGPVGPADHRAGGARAQLGGGAGLGRRHARRARRRPHHRRGAHGPTVRRRAVRAAAAARAVRRRRVRRGDRRLRADRRDAAAAVVPRRRALVAREGLPAAGSDPRRGAAVRADGARRVAAGRGGHRRRAAPRGEPHRDARDPPRPRAGLAAPRDEPRPDGRRRGAPDVHLPQPLRLLDRRGRRQPRVPRRRRPVLRGVARDAAGGARRGRRGVLPRARPARAVLRAGGPRRGDARPARRRAVRRRARRGGGSARHVHAGARHRARRRVAAARPPVRRQGRPPAEEDRHRARRQGRWTQTHDDVAAGPCRVPAFGCELRGRRPEDHVRCPGRSL
ncbi:MAG: Arsenical pump-driving ATPase TEMP, partial [uncultured Solirubrobacteraceae bacterium]